MPDPRKPIGVGIVGLSATGGWAAGAHLPALSAVDGMELRALAASSEASAQAAGAAYGVPAYTSVEQLASDENGGRPTKITPPSGYDDYPALAGTVIHTLVHAYAAIRDDLTHGTAIAPDFTHAVKRHRLLDAIARSAATGQRKALHPHDPRAQ